MKNAKFIKEEDVGFEEVSENWVALKFGNEKFVMDMDTLIDLSFRCASFLAYLEGKEESGLEACDDESQNLCCHHKNSLH